MGTDLFSLLFLLICAVIQHVKLWSGGGSSNGLWCKIWTFELCSALQQPWVLICFLYFSFLFVQWYSMSSRGAVEVVVMVCDVKLNMNFWVVIRYYATWFHRFIYTKLLSSKFIIMYYCSIVADPMGARNPTCDPRVRVWFLTHGSHRGRMQLPIAGLTTDGFLLHPHLTRPIPIPTSGGELDSGCLCSYNDVFTRRTLMEALLYDSGVVCTVVAMEGGLETMEVWALWNSCKSLPFVQRIAWSYFDYGLRCGWEKENVSNGWTVISGL
jgi:hypothetical protein